MLGRVNTFPKHNASANVELNYKFSRTRGVSWNCRWVGPTAGVYLCVDDSVILVIYGRHMFNWKPSDACIEKISKKQFN